MTVLIGHGYVGTAIKEELFAQEIQFSWANHDNWQNYAWSNELLINAAGYLGSPNIDSCEIHKRETVEGNILWPTSLINRTTIHISTGCVYEGDNDGSGWTESDKPNFDKSFYSLSKLIAEEQLSPTLLATNSYILRIRQPFGAIAHNRNLLTKLKSYKKLMNVVNSMSCIDDVAKVVAYIVKYRPTPGIYNVCNPGSISVKEIADLLELEKEWFTPEEFSIACPAPRSNCLLNVDKITSLFPLRSVHEAMKHSIREYK